MTPAREELCEDKPMTFDTDIYFALSDYGTAGLEGVVSPNNWSRQALLNDLIGGHLEHVAYVFALNPAEGWSHDASADIAQDWWNAIADVTHDERDVPGFITEHYPRALDELRRMQADEPRRLMAAE